MAKDAAGHGSDARGTGAQGMRLVKTHVLGPHSAKVYNNPDWNEKVVKTFRDGVYQSKNDYHTDDLADAHGTAQSQLNRWAGQDAAAAGALASGPKSAAAPVHDSMSGGYDANGVRPAMSGAPNRWDVKGTPTSDAQRAKSAAADSAMGFGAPRNHAAEQRSFNSGAREINRLRRQGK